MTEEERKYEREWHLDKKVPVALIVTIFTCMAAQTGGALWWAAGITWDVNQLKSESLTRAPQAERLIRLEEQMRGITLSLDEIKHLLRTPPEQRR